MPGPMGAPAVPASAAAAARTWTAASPAARKRTNAAREACARRATSCPAHGKPGAIPRSSPSPSSGDTRGRRWSRPRSRLACRASGAVGWGSPSASPHLAARVAVLLTGGLVAGGQAGCCRGLPGSRRRDDWSLRTPSRRGWVPRPSGPMRAAAGNALAADQIGRWEDHRARSSAVAGSSGCLVTTAPAAQTASRTACAQQASSG